MFALVPVSPILKQPESSGRFRSTEEPFGVWRASRDQPERSLLRRVTFSQLPVMRREEQNREIENTSQLQNAAF